MHHSILDRQRDIAVACRRFGVLRLAVFGSAARGTDFDVARSDADLLVEFGRMNGPDPYLALKAELERILKRRIDLLDRQALDESRNYIRQAAILSEAELVYEA